MPTSKKPAAKSAPKRHGAKVPKQTPRKPASRRAPGVARGPVAVLPAEIREAFTVERIDLVRSQLPHDATDADLARLLLEAIRLGTDPVRGGIYLKAQALRDGAPATYAVVARRDVLLAFAERQGSFRDIAADSIYEADTFELVQPDARADTLAGRGGVLHMAGHPKDRGKLYGAWALVEVQGAHGPRTPYRFVALCSEYLPDGVEALAEDDPRRMYPDRYMVKAAQCWPLRMAFGLNDVVGAEEMPDFASRRPAPEPAAPAKTGPDPLDELDTEALNLFAQAQECVPGTFTAAGLRAALLAAPDDEARAAIVGEMRGVLVAHHEARLAELDAFDADTLDEDGQADHVAERDRVAAALDGLAQPTPA